jgi:hypothetical protein
MSKTLLESDFLAVDLGSMFKRQKSTNNRAESEPAATPVDSETPSTTQAQNQKMTFIEWGEELKNRLAENRAMDRESRLNEYDIETKFFKEFFSSKWDAECAKQLMLMGEPLRKALKDLEFDPRVNPILKFLTLDYVRENLIKTKLLNINTFKAIYYAVTNELIADSEFFVASDYNIIYCRDLYKKSSEDIKEYLKLQKKILSPSAKVYTKEDQEKNRKIFLVSTGKSSKSKTTSGKPVIRLTTLVPSVKDPKVMLNSIDTLQNSLCSTKTSSKHSKATSSTALNNLAEQIKEPAEVYAVLQYLSMSTGSKKASQALSNKKLNGISTQDVTKATAKVSGIISQVQLSKSDLEAFIDLLIDNL